MAGASFAHNLITLNISAQLHSRLITGDCLAFPGDVRVLCPTGLRTYPDAGVVCGTPDLERVHGAETLKNPALIVEVLSPSTEAYDRGNKFSNYQTIPSLKSYVLVSQSYPLVDCFSRQQDGGWLMTTARGLNSTLEIGWLGVSLSLAAVYSRVAFPTDVSHNDPVPSNRFSTDSDNDQSDNDQIDP